MLPCIRDGKDLASSIMPKINNDNTEFMFISLRRTKYLHNLPSSISHRNDQFPFTQFAKNLGFSTTVILIEMNSFSILLEHITANFINISLFVNS